MEEGEVDGKEMFVADQHAAELTKPSVGAFDLPASFVASQFPAILIFPHLVVVPIGSNQFDAALFPSFPQWIGVIPTVGDYPLGLLSRPAFGPGDADFVERGVRKRNFCRRGTFQPNSQRNTFTVSQYHPLCAFTALGFTDRIASFLAGAKLPSRKVSSHFSKPRSSKAPNNVRQALSQTPLSSHCFNRRQQVDGEGYSSGRKRHAAPVCRIHRMPSRQLRFGTGGRPRPSSRRFGSGNSGPISAHWSSVKSFCRFFMPEAQQSNYFKGKYLV
jgi:hypothetical protein